MLGTLMLVSFVTTLFLLFVGSFIFVVLEPFVGEEMLKYFADVAAINPSLGPVEVVAGTLISYFIVSALVAVLLRISWELKERGDVYGIDDALKEGAVAGTVGLLLGALLRFLGLQEISNTAVYVAAVLFEARRSPKVALLVFVTFVLLGTLFLEIVRRGLIPAEFLTPLYYLSLIILPPVVIYAARSI
ncbi:MAG: hypothetical protein GXO00_02705 [Candidatus Diapherotrites archaeon]|nr:hypothetical protein [Candidatus Diapherotrites archaeon]